MKCVVCYEQKCMCKPRSLILALMMILFPMVSSAECDIKTLKNDVIAPYSKPLIVDTFTGLDKGIAQAENFQFPDYPFTVKGESFILLTFDVKIKFQKMKQTTKRMIAIRGVDLGSCTLDTFDSKDVFGTSI